MASRTGADPRSWKTFWSTIDKQGNRYRHQVRQHRTDVNIWWVRTEVLESDSVVPYFTANILVPPEHGKNMFNMRQTWSNVDEEGRPMYPPEYEGGFKGLT